MPPPPSSTSSPAPPLGMSGPSLPISVGTWPSQVAIRGTRGRLLRRAAPQDPVPRQPAAARELLEQAGLAEASVARQEEQAAGTLTRGGQRALEGLKLTGSADEAGRDAGLGHGHAGVTGEPRYGSRPGQAMLGRAERYIDQIRDDRSERSGRPPALGLRRQVNGMEYAKGSDVQTRRSSLDRPRHLRWVAAQPSADPKAPPAAVPADGVGEDLTRQAQVRGCTDLPVVPVVDSVRSWEPSPEPAGAAVRGEPSDLFRTGRVTLRPRPRRPLVFLAALLAVGLLGRSAPAHALCNIIPPAERNYPSTLGSVTNPIVAPGDEVTLSLDACDAGPGFASNPAANVVTVTFLPAGDPQAVVNVTSVTVPPADCAAGPGPCLTLRFTMPPTTSATYPDGLAGPAEIRVVSGGSVAAQIGPLFQPRPATTCDKQAEPVFRQLTVLPPPNVFQTLIDQPSTRILAALDGSGSLLVPFDYRDVLPLGPGAPVAALLSGSTTIDAFASAPGVPIDVPDSSWVRSFTIDGRPVPPLLRATDLGNEVFGASDGAEGIVRIARTLGAALPIFDLQYLRTSNGRGPVVIPGGRYAVEPGVAVPLANLRSATRAVAFARDESVEGNLNGPPFSADADVGDDVVHIIDVPTFISTLTGRAASPIVNPITGGSIETSDEVVAFLESEAQQGGADLNGDGQPATDNLLRVLTAAGDSVTSDVPGAALLADPFPGIDKKPVAIDGDLVYFREPEVGFQARSGLTEQGMDIDVSPDGRLLAITRSGAPCGEIRVRRRDGATGSIVTASVAGVRAECGVTNGANGVVFSPTGRFLYVAAPGTNRVGAFAIAVAPEQIGVGGLFSETLTTAAPAATRLAVTPVTPDGTVLQSRVSLYALAPAANSVTAFNVSESLVVGSPNLLFVRTLKHNVECVPSATLGCIPNFVNPRDLATSPDGHNVYVAVYGSDRVKVFTRVASSADIVETQELVDNGSGGTRLDGVIDVAVSPDGRFVYALSDLEDAVTTFSRDLVTGTLTLVGTIFQGPGVDGLDQGRSIEVSPDGIGLYTTESSGQVAAFDRNTASGLLIFNRVRGGGFPTLASAGLAISPDSEHVYTQYDFQGTGEVYARDGDLRAFDVATGATRPGIDALNSASSLASVRSGRAAWIAQSQAFGTLFPAVTLYDAASDAVLPLEAASGFANKLALSSQILALAAPEGLVVGNADGDGVTSEDTLVVVSLANSAAPPTIVGADAIEVGATDVCAGGSAAGSACDEAADCPGSSCQGVAVSLKVRVANFDGGADLALAVHRQGVPGSIEIGRNVVDFQVSGNLIAFRDRENGLFRVNCSNQNEIAFDNTDADCTDLVMRVYDLVTNQVVDTQQATIKCEQPGCEPGLPYKILGDSVAFLTREVDQGGQDLDGDGNADDTVVQIFNVRSASKQVVKTRGTFRLPPLPTTFLGAPIVYRDVFEGDLGRDVNEDGDQSDVVVLVDGDSDGDGVFDSSDQCVEKPDAAQLDSDLDGLGDACDPAPFCEAVTPAAPPLAPAAANACQDALGKAAQTMFKSWAKALASCLDRVAKGKLDGPAGEVCRGSIGVSSTVAPQDLPTLEKIFASFGAFQKSIEKKCTTAVLAQLDACGATPASLLDCVAFRAGSAAIRTTEIAYGDVTRITDAKQQRCQKAIGRQAINYATNAGGALRRCLDRVNDGRLTGNAAQLCLGSDGPLGTILPTDAQTADKLVKAAKMLEKALAKPCADALPVPLDACGDDAASIAACTRCTGYRHALDTIQASYGP